MIVTVAVALQSGREQAGWTLHTRDVQTRLEQASAAFERAESARRGYLLLGVPRAIVTHDQAQTTLSGVMAELATLTRDNPAQQRRLQELQALLVQRAAARDQTFSLVRDGRQDEARAAFAAETVRQEVIQVRDLLAVMVRAEDDLLRIRADQEGDAVEFAVWTMVALGPALLLLAFATIWLVYRYTADLSNSREALRRLNLGLEDVIQARTTDLRSANEEIQRFAYIVSHDLRSPLVNVMGFTSEIEAGLPVLNAMMTEAKARAPDLVTRDAAQVVESDLPEAIGFIRASTSKMDRLINAILRLSREGRRVLTPETLNMQVLLDGVVANLKQRQDQADAAITVRWPIPDIVNDRLAMEQVFSNLIDNALKYLQPGRPGVIEVSGRAEGARVVFEVRDNGRGIDPRDHQRVFDLFRRAGVQDQPGEGIGLAHVRALVQRLGGSITVESQLGEGATFRVSLPQKIDAEGNSDT